MEALKILGPSLFTSPTTVVGVVVLLIIIYFISVGASSRETGKEPPGPRPLPLLGNLLQLDLQRPYKTLCQVGALFWLKLMCNIHATCFISVWCHCFYFTAFQGIWVCIYSLFWTQESGRPGWVQDSQRGSGQLCR